MDICVDFDGTCVTHAYPEMGVDIGAAPVLKRLLEQGHNLIIFTMRSGKELDDAVNWFREKVGEPYGINTNPTQLSWTTSPKALGHLYIDDAALGAPLKYDSSISPRKFIDWAQVYRYLRFNEILRH